LDSHPSHNLDLERQNLVLHPWLLLLLVEVKHLHQEQPHMVVRGCAMPDVAPYLQMTQTPLEAAADTAPAAPAAAGLLPAFVLLLLAQRQQLPRHHLHPLLEPPDEVNMRLILQASLHQAMGRTGGHYVQGLQPQLKKQLCLYCML
jgi:hypothetical protein